MVAINKAEKEAIHARYPNVHIVRTMKQKSKRHRYYCEESTGAMRLLNELRGNEPVKPKEGGFNRNHKRRK